MTSQPERRIRLCADDYGISPAVNRGIRELIDKRRLNATSVMVVGPALDRDEASALTGVATEEACAIGLHVTLTAPFSPLTLHFDPLRGGTFLPLGRMLLMGSLRRLDRDIIGSEIAAQLARFTALFERPPDYVDGHQHVHLFPQVRDAFLEAVRAAAPTAWVRQCGRPVTRLMPPKAWLLDTLSARFRRLCDDQRIAYNPGFAGAYDFTRETDFAALMPTFLDGLPDSGLVMCHPGYVDDVLISLDPLTTQRERELAFLAGDGFPALLQSLGVVLATAAGPTKN
jgi:chitin disaccharide deacetylase